MPNPKFDPKFLRLLYVFFYLTTISPSLSKISVNTCFIAGGSSLVLRPLKYNKNDGSKIYRRWFFSCHSSNSTPSVLWKPPSAFNMLSTDGGGGTSSLFMGNFFNLSSMSSQFKENVSGSKAKAERTSSYVLYLLALLRGP